MLQEQKDKTISTSLLDANKNNIYIGTYLWTTIKYWMFSQ